MKLHHNEALFTDIIARASQHPSRGGLGIRPQFIEKDYWITNALRSLAESQYKDYAVFKGGTSLSKAYRIGARFSEDIDIAVVGTEKMSDAKLKTIIRSTEKAMAEDLSELTHPQTSKGSRYRKTYFSYPLRGGADLISGVTPGQLLLEINSFANPIPYNKIQISSFVYEYLVKIMRADLIEEFGIGPFEINVLDKRTTMTEKIVSLIRFSFAESPVSELEAKIRHFYDLHYLLQDKECREYLYGAVFKTKFFDLLNHDKELFDNPNGWRDKSVASSPLITDFCAVWRRLRNRYEKELPLLAYSLAVPGSDSVEDSMMEIIDILRL